MLIIMPYFFLIFFFQNKEDESTEVLLARSQVALFEVSCAEFSCIHLLPKVLNTYLEHFSMMSTRHCGRCGDQMVRVLDSMLGGLSSQTDHVIVLCLWAKHCTFPEPLSLSQSIHANGSCKLSINVA